MGSNRRRWGRLGFRRRRCVRRPPHSEKIQSSVAKWQEKTVKKRAIFCKFAPFSRKKTAIFTPCNRAVVREPPAASGFSHPAKRRARAGFPFARSDEYGVRTISYSNRRL